MNTSSLPLAAGIGLSLLLLSLSSATARPVTSADLVGKQICWSHGDNQTYYPGGKYSSTGGGDGTWVLTSAGIEVKASIWIWSGAIEILPDKSLTLDWIHDGQTHRYIGHYCKY